VGILDASIVVGGENVSYGLLLLRLVLGLGLAAHGAQKLFGWFGGGGLQGTAGFFDSKLRFRAPAAMAFFAGLGEFGGGVLIALGFLTPLGAVALVSVMVVAIACVHWQNGYFITKGGYEFNLLILAAGAALAATGPGRFSLDRALGWDDNLSGVWWGVGALVVGALGGAATVVAFRRPEPRGEEAAQT
jgi:putative oxidoreductase